MQKQKFSVTKDNFFINNSHILFCLNEYYVKSY